MCKKRQIKFTTFNRNLWLKQIYEVYSEFAGEHEPCEIVFNFDAAMNRYAMEPLHVVTYACLIHYLIDKGHTVKQSKVNGDMFDYIFAELNFSAYWRGGRNHVEAKSSGNIFNLWRIVESEKDLYAKHVEEYFKRKYFGNKDLSAVSISLVEAFYNVFDHADANGNAFSIIFYNEATQTLSYAVADFGIGIPTSVRRFNALDWDDVRAIMWAIEDSSTVRSTMRNKGFGMGNILSASSVARIFSNKGLVRKEGEKYSSWNIKDFAFPGTLLYLDVVMSDFEEEEVLDTFEL